MSPMLNIDFGNSFTKVGFRLDREAQTRLLKDSSLVWDDANISIPTLAAELDGRWHYGSDVIRFREGTPGLRVHRNWKPHFFDVPSSTHLKKRHEPMVVSNGSRPAGIAVAQWEKLQSILTPEQLTHLQEDAAPAPSSQDWLYKEIGLGFFTWLNHFIDPHCRKLLGRSVSEVPTRISLPSFGSMAAAELLLTELLEEAGWLLDKSFPVLAEPYANSIGMFTEGTNSLMANGKAPNFGKMFIHTGLLKRMREASLHDGESTAWTLVVDVGGYTVDCAMVGIDLTDPDPSLKRTLDGKPGYSHSSTAVGVTDLDTLLRENLSIEKSEALATVMAAPDQQRIESFHKQCYGAMKSYFLTNKLTIGKDSRERAEIRSLVDGFAEEIAEDAEKFLSLHQYDRVDDLILTGGGMMIPAVRQAVWERLKGYGVSKVHAYRGQGKPHRKLHEISYEHARGATAIGGASVFFDFAETA